jgi:hypothetical protein
MNPTFVQRTAAPEQGLGMNITDLDVPGMPEGPGMMIGNAECVLTPDQMRRAYDIRSMQGGALMPASTRRALEERAAQPSIDWTPPAMSARSVCDGVMPLDTGDRDGATLVKFPGHQVGGTIAV